MKHLFQMSVQMHLQRCKEAVKHPSNYPLHRSKFMISFPLRGTTPYALSDRDKHTNRPITQHISLNETQSPLMKCFLCLTHGEMMIFGKLTKVVRLPDGSRGNVERSRAATLLFSFQTISWLFIPNALPYRFLINYSVKSKVRRHLIVVIFALPRSCIFSNETKWLNISKRTWKGSLHKARVQRPFTSYDHPFLNDTRYNSV